jgi:hypothetical protein
MHKRPKHASTPIDNENDHEISDSQKKHFTKLGYKPYLSYRGKVKWLSYEQHIYEKIKYTHKKRAFDTASTRPRGYRRQKWYKLIYRIIIHNWLLLMIVLFVIVFLMYYNSIISFISNYII